MIFHTLPDIQSVSEAIHNAVAPVFLITGIGSILSVLVNRLGRAVDRARIINDMSLKEKKAYFNELNIIISRTTWIRRAITLITISALIFETSDEIFSLKSVVFLTSDDVSWSC